MDGNGSKTQVIIDRNRFYLNFPSQKEGSKICIVSLIGNTCNGITKSNIFNSFIGADIFNCNSTMAIEGSCYIEGFLSAKDHVLFLHLVSMNDESFCTKLKELWNKESLDESAKIKEANHPRSAIYQETKLFKGVNLLRQYLKNSMVEILERCKEWLDRDWINRGRLCAPQMLFLFQSLHQDETLDDLKKDIFDEFGKLKTFSNTSEDGKNLGTISNDQDFVYILSEEELPKSHFKTTQDYSNLDSEASSSPETIDAISSSQPCSSVSPSLSQSQPPGLQPLPQIPSCSSATGATKGDLRALLAHHINAVLRTESIGGVPCKVELCTITRVMKVLYDLCWTLEEFDKDKFQLPHDINAKILKFFFCCHFDELPPDFIFEESFQKRFPYNIYISDFLIPWEDIGPDQQQKSTAMKRTRNEDDHEDGLQQQAKRIVKEPTSCRGGKSGQKLSLPFPPPPPPPPSSSSKKKRGQGTVKRS